MKLRIDRVKPGMFLTKSVYLNNSMPLIFVKEGDSKEITEKELELLKNKGVRDLYVDFELPKIGTVSGETEELAEQILLANDYGNAVKVADMITTEILNETPYSYDLNMYFLQNQDLYNHSVHTTSFAIALTKKINEDYNMNLNYREIALSCLLHDVGKNVSLNELAEFKKLSFNRTYFPDADLSCFDKYDPRCYPIYSWGKIAKESSISSLVKTSILIQDENESKTGPLNFDMKQLTVKNNKVALVAKIINTCSYFDDLLYQVSTGELVEKIKQDISDRKIDKVVGSLLLRYIPIYPVGTKVILSNGLEATVIGDNPNYPDRPVISVMMNGIENEFDLLTNTTVTIKEINRRDFEFLKSGREK